MSLESAERLVERILRQLGVRYQVEQDLDGETQRIVTDEGSLANLPPELRHYVTRQKPAHAKDNDGTGQGELG